MSLPPAFLDELRARLSLARVVGRKVVWDMRKSNQGKSDWWAPCPFHQEKSASFHVDDRKGYYYCFGCHAKGDALTFVRETENVGFMEAVEILAREAGMAMPERDPRAAAVADRRSVLSGIMEEVVAFYRLQLRTAAAREARAYLARRGLDDETCARWHLGYAPDDRGALVRHMTARGVALADLVATGMVAEPEGGGAPYDRFRGRITFAIRDGRGRAISLGGRALDPGARAKYLNGPETILFDKGRTLFNLAPAREAAGRGGPLVVAEGYMDVIALAGAGLAAVAPLGTAVTAEQLALMWRIADEPVIALDGDTAGLRAAHRVIDLALPLLEAGKGLRFALLPGGMDPDDLIRAQGPGAMRAVIDAAEPMVRLLWRRETEGRVLDSPERKAALDKSLRATLARIGDASIRAHYGEEIRALRWELFRSGRRPRRGARGAPPLAAPPAAARGSRLAGAAGIEDELREAAILATLIANPRVIADFAHEIEAMECHGEGHGAIRDALIPALESLPDAGAGPQGALAGGDLRAAIAARIGGAALDRLLAERHVILCPAVARPGDDGLARQTLAEEFAKLRARRSHASAIEEAMADIDGLADEWLTRRLSEAAAGIDVTRPRESEDAREVHVAPNGLAIDREERHALDRLLGQIDFGRKGGG
ncbi:MAG: DNA primase [Rubellimicrobium sp.]|nr:DNA primase [Rubellimicrobium sp.]